MKEWMEILIRSLALFIITLAIVRVLGKRQIAKATPFHFITYSVIALLTVLISTKIIENLSFGLIALGIWTLFPIALNYMALKSKILHDWINGKEMVLIRHGKVMEESLNQARLTGEELLKELRSKNVFNFADVEFAVLESTGEMNVLLKADKKPITPHDMEMKVSPTSESQTVILDGNILDEPLSTRGLNRNWLNAQLENLGVSLDNVFIGQVDSSGDFYVDLFDDAIQIPQPTVKEMLYANLEKTQADLVTYALETEDEAMKNIYSADADNLKQALDKLRPYLLR